MRNIPSGLPALAILVLSALAGCSDDLEQTAQRQFSERTAGILTVVIEAGVGSLELVGDPGADTISAVGTAKATMVSGLNDVQFDVVRSGTELTIRALTPPETEFDAVISLPADMIVSITKSVGSVSVRDLGSLELSLEVGSASIRGVDGDLIVRSLGVGDLRVDDLSGNLTVEQFGVGNVQVEGVDGDVAILEAGVGRISVVDIAGNFSVRGALIGDITHTDVRGIVSIQ